MPTSEVTLNIRVLDLKEMRAFLDSLRELEELTTDAVEALDYYDEHGRVYAELRASMRRALYRLEQRKEEMGVLVRPDAEEHETA